MTQQHRRRIAILAGVTAVAAAVFVVALNCATLVESWHLWRLSSDDPNARRTAAAALVEMRSLRAIPALLEGLAEDEEFARRCAATELVVEAIHAWSAENSGRGLEATAIVRALGPQGHEALPALLVGLRHENPIVSLVACDAIAAIDPPPRAAWPDLLRALDAVDMRVARARGSSQQRELRRLSRTRLGRLLFACLPSRTNCKVSELIDAVPRDLRYRTAAFRTLGACVRLELDRSATDGLELDVLDDASRRLLDQLAVLTASEDEHARLGAVCLLSSNIYSAHGFVHQALAPCLRDPSALVRREAVRSFVGSGERAIRQVLPTLRECLRDPDAVVRGRAVAAFRKLDDGTIATALPELTRLVDDTDAPVRLAAMRTIGELGTAARSAAPAIARRMSVEDLDERELALAALVAVEPTPTDELIDAFVAQLDDAPVTRDLAVFALDRFGPSARRAMPSLECVLEDAADASKQATTEPPAATQRRSIDASLYLHVLTAISRIVDDSPAMVRPIATRFDPVLLDEPDTSRTLVHLLDSWYHEFDGPEIGLTTAFRSAGVRAAAVAPVVSETLLQALDQARDVWDVGHLVETLGEIGPAAPDAFEAVLRACRSTIDLDEHEGWRTELVTSTRRYLRALVETAAEQPDASKAVDVLAEVLANAEHYTPETDLDAIRLLGRLRADPSRSVALLIDELDSNVRRRRQAAAESLGAFGRRANAAVRPLVERLDDPDPRVRQAAAEALGRIGSPEGGTVERLVERLADTYPRVRRAAAHALGKIGPDAADVGGVVAKLTAATDDADLIVRRRAVEALGKLGPAARAAIPALKRAADNAAEDAAVRSRAQTALARLES